MNSSNLHKLLLLTLMTAGTLRAQVQVPDIINYQGRISNLGTNHPGPTLQFKFALVNAAGTTTEWSNDNTSANGSEPAAFVTLSVANGLFFAPLGDTALPGMTRGIPTSAFDNRDLHLRIWVRDTNGPAAFQLLAPDQRLGSVGYAMVSAGVINGAIGASKLADGAITPAKLADEAVTSSKLADNAVTTARIANGAVTAPKIGGGAVTYSNLAPDLVALLDPTRTSVTFGSCDNCARVDLFSTSECYPAVSLDGCASMVSVFMQANSVEAARFQALPGSGGAFRLWDSVGRFRLFGSASNDGGFLSFFSGQAFGPSATLQAEDSNGGASLLLSTPPISALNLARPSISLLAQNSTGSPEISLSVTNGLADANTTVRIIAAEAPGQGSAIKLFRGNGNQTVEIDAERGDGTGGPGGFIALFDGTNTTDAVIRLDANAAGGARIVTGVLEITGGADLSENFDIETRGEAAAPGMIVCLDPANPGRLVLSGRAYDSTVAGIISGAGGVKPGMLMGQHATRANGKYPVALTGRVYCWADASSGAIRPGDLITSSDIPGHGMKVADPTRAHGTIIGKAMTSLEEGKGLVLVLVSLQ